MQTRPGSFEYEDLLACGRGEMFGEGNAQLPLPPMLMFDRIAEISEQGGEYGKGLIRAELEVTPDLWFFACHFKGDPVMPGCLAVDALWQLLGFFLGWLGSPGKGRALGLGEETGDLTPGKAADLVLLRAPAGGTLEAVLDESPGWEAALGAIFTLAREETVLETRVAGEVVFSREAG